MSSYQHIEDVQKWVDFMKKYAMEQYKTNFYIGEDLSSSTGGYWSPRQANKYLGERFEEE